MPQSATHSKPRTLAVAMLVMGVEAEVVLVLTLVGGPVAMEPMDTTTGDRRGEKDIIFTCSLLADYEL